MFENIFYIVVVLFFVLFTLYMAVKSSKQQKKAFDFIHESHKISAEGVEVQKKILHELEIISKKLEK